MSDTPRTDALWLTEANSEKAWYRVAKDMRNHSRQLERELAVVTEERDRLKKALVDITNEYYGGEAAIAHEALDALEGDQL